MKRYLTVAFRDSEDANDISFKTVDNPDNILLSFETVKIEVGIQDLVTALEQIKVYLNKEKENVSCSNE